MASAVEHYVSIDQSNVDGMARARRYFEACTVLMDDDIRERLHLDLAPCTDGDFLAAYASAHLDKYGEEFECE